MLSVLMLTPDIGLLDRRIAQEAGSLASRGFSVDIYPVFDPLSRSAEGLPAGARNAGVLSHLLEAQNEPAFHVVVLGECGRGHDALSCATGAVRPSRRRSSASGAKSDD